MAGEGLTVRPTAIALCLVASLVLLTASAPAAAPKRITGELSKPGYTVIALGAGEERGANRRRQLRLRALETRARRRPRRPRPRRSPRRARRRQKREPDPRQRRALGRLARRTSRNGAAEKSPGAAISLPPRRDA